MKWTLLLLTIIIKSITFAQFCPFIGPDITLPCGQNQTTLTADLSQCSPGQNPLETTTYLNSQITYTPQTNTGTQIQMTDDSQQGPFPIGFNFCFFGNTYNQFYIGSNGWISFSPGQPTTFTSATIPSVAANIPKNCIMGPWQDWHPGIGGQIRYQVQGTAPCRKLVVSWINVPMFNCATTLGTFHIVIYESTNVIENHIQSKQFCGWANGTAVQGIHNALGTVAITTPGRNSTQWLANNDARRWTPNGAAVAPIPTWYQVGNPVAIGTGLSITVTPPQGGAQYTCRLEYPTCFSGWSICNQNSGLPPDTILVIPGLPNLPQPQVQIINPSCNGFCDGEITIIPQGVAPFNINWSNGQTDVTTITGLCQGQYVADITDAQGCQVTTNPIQIVDPAIPQISPILGSDTTCIYDQNALFSVTNQPWTFQWVSNGPIIGQGTNTITTDLSQLVENTIYQISVTAITDLGCPTTTETFDTYLFNITPQITSINPLCVYDDCQALEVTPQGGVLSINQQVITEFCPQESEIGQNTITYNFEQSGCEFTSQIDIIVNPIPTFEFTPNDPVVQICDVDQTVVQLNILSTPAADSVWWTFNSVTETNMTYINTFSEGFWTIYTQVWANNCLSDQQSNSITVIKCPQVIYYVPNSFTPDGDEFNNQFGVIFTDGFDPYQFKLEIYNRWGEIIWESNNHQASWDGTYAGKLVQSGIYVWKIRFGNDNDDGMNEIWGHVNLIR